MSRIIAFFLLYFYYSKQRIQKKNSIVTFQVSRNVLVLGQLK